LVPITFPVHQHTTLQLLPLTQTSSFSILLDIMAFVLMLDLFCSSSSP
jgi:hypothetical protein